MSIYNYLQVRSRCPWCHVESEVDAEFRFGLRDLVSYRIGDTITWEGRGVRTPTHRPPGGNYRGPAYVECPNCGRDYWLEVEISNDIITSFDIDLSRPGYITDDTRSDGT